jgi:rhamnulokinase
MKKPLNCVAVDLGASGGKVVRGSFDGSKVWLKEIYRFSNSPIQINGHIYWDVLRLFDEVKKGLAKAGGQGDKLASIGLDSWGNDYCLLDRDGNLVENPHSYRDPRTDGIMQQAFARMSRDAIYKRTGVQFMQHNTLFQLYSQVLGKSPLLKAAATYLMVPDLFNYWLSGEKSCEFTNATTTQFFDLYKDAWCVPLLDAFEIPQKIMPPVVRPGTRLGTLEKWICDDLGISTVPVIAVGTHDTASAASVVPAAEDDYAFLSSGTWSLFGAEVKSPVVNKAGLKYNFSCYGGVCETYLVWKNIQALWLLQECARVWNEGGQKCSHGELVSMAEKAKPFGAVIDTDDRLFLTPGDFPARIADYCKSTGQKPPAGRGEITRCILESLALKYRYTFEKLQMVLGRKLSRIYVVGGGSRNVLLSRFTAEATGVPVIAGHPEATALGNFMLQLVTLGEVRSLQESREIVRRSFRSKTYQLSNSEGWDKMFVRFMGITTGGASPRK